MERTENEIHQSLQDLRALGGLSRLDDDDDESGSVASNGAETMATTQLHTHPHRQHQIHTLRRCLRRLDRSLLRLKDECLSHQQQQYEQEQQQNNGEHDAPNTESVLSHDMCVNLLTILLGLRIPVDDEGALEIAMSINHTVADIWMQQGCRVEDPNDGRNLLRRIVHHAACSGHHQSHLASQTSSDVFSLCSPWLKVVHFQGQIMEDQQAPSAALPGNGHEDSSQTSHASSHQGGILQAATNPAQLLLTLQQILRRALDSFQMDAQWDIGHAQDESKEAVLQWRSLTGNLFEQVTQLYKQQHQQKQQQQMQVDDSRRQGQESAAVPPPSSVQEWLECCYAAINPQHHQQRNQNGVRQTTILAKQLIHSLQLYAAELVEYALDALDGAAAAAADSNRMVRDHHQQDEQQHQCQRARDGMSIDEEQCTATSSTLSGHHQQQQQQSNDDYLVILAIRDSLRHVAVATHVLQSLDTWSLVPRELPRKLWKTLATSFVRDLEWLPSDVKGFICHYTLTAAQLALLQVDVANNDTPTSTLAMTFLRALEHPNLLLEANVFWTALETRISPPNGDLDLKHVLQASALTLQTASTKTNHLSPDDPLENQQQALLQRILHTLRAASGRMNGDDAWDLFFQRRLYDDTTACPRPM